MRQWLALVLLGAALTSSAPAFYVEWRTTVPGALWESRWPVTIEGTVTTNPAYGWLLFRTPEDRACYHLVVRTFEPKTHVFSAWSECPGVVFLPEVVGP